MTHKRITLWRPRTEKRTDVMLRVRCFGFDVAWKVDCETSSTVKHLKCNSYNTSDWYYSLDVIILLFTVSLVRQNRNLIGRYAVRIFTIVTKNIVYVMTCEFRLFLHQKSISYIIVNLSSHVSKKNLARRRFRDVNFGVFCNIYRGKILQSSWGSRDYCFTSYEIMILTSDHDQVKANSLS